MWCATCKLSDLPYSGVVARHVWMLMIAKNMSNYKTNSLVATSLNAMQMRSSAQLMRHARALTYKTFVWRNWCVLQPCSVLETILCSKGFAVPLTMPMGLMQKQYRTVGVRVQTCLDSYSLTAFGCKIFELRSHSICIALDVKKELPEQQKLLSR
jgi:hypothetical protein